MAPESFPRSLNNQFMVFACWYFHMILTSPNYDHIHGELLFFDSISCTSVHEALSWFYQTTLIVRLVPDSTPYYSMSQGFEVASSFMFVDTSATSHAQSSSHQTKGGWPSYTMTSLHVPYFFSLQTPTNGLDSLKVLNCNINSSAWEPIKVP